jgi:hypothetical protein
MEPELVVTQARWVPDNPPDQGSARQSRSREEEDDDRDDDHARRRRRSHGEAQGPDQGAGKRQGSRLWVLGIIIPATVLLICGLVFVIVFVPEGSKKAQKSSDENIPVVMISEMYEVMWDDPEEFDERWGGKEVHLLGAIPGSSRFDVKGKPTCSFVMVETFYPKMWGGRHSCDGELPCYAVKDAGAVPGYHAFHVGKVWVVGKVRRNRDRKEPELYDCRFVWRSR